MIIRNDKTDAEKAAMVTRISDAIQFEKQYGFPLKVAKAAPEMLKALEHAYKCSGEKNYLTKPVLDEMLKAIRKATS